MKIPFKIAVRYFFSRKSGGTFNLISVISGISLLGYITGAAALIIVLSVFNGFEQLFVSLYNNFDSDIQITATTGKSFKLEMVPVSELKKIEGIDKLSMVLEENVLLKYGNRQCIATAKGVDTSFLEMTSLDSCMISGEKVLEQNGIPYALSGQGISYQLGLDPSDLFNRIVFYVPDRLAGNSMEPTGSFRQDALYPSGSFSVQQEVDEKYILVPLPFIQNLIQKPGEVSSIEIKVSQKANQDKLIDDIQKLFPKDHFTVRNRYQQREAFFKIMKSEKLISYFILFFILLIAASNTIGSLFIQVIEKKKDIRLLSSVGLPVSQVRLIYVFRSLIQAFAGGLTGLLFGLVLCFLQEQYGFVKLSEAAVFVFQTYPVYVLTSDVFLVMGTVMFLGLLTSIYPAIRAGRSAV